jgi:hypothetical protein
LVYCSSSSLCLQSSELLVYCSSSSLCLQSSSVMLLKKGCNI